MYSKKHLQFPFESNCLIKIKNEKQIEKVTCELAESVIEIFQSLNFRKENDFNIPLILQFKNPNVQSYVLFNYNFAVEHICIDTEGKVVKSYLQPDNKSSATFIHAYSSYNFIILAPKGFIRQYKIANQTSVQLNIIL